MPCSAIWCIRYKEMYTTRAIRPSTIIEPRVKLPIRLPTVEKRLRETSEP
ncbi:Uncharacterised protein [Vibrio cholerae]|nr:Uncharacterised protein [Vibrio cholerae]